jgi:hypothetical protein
LADLLLSVRHLRDLPARWGPMFHTSLLLVDPRELPLVMGGDKGRAALWLVSFIPPPPALALVAPLVTYEDVFRPGHVDFDHSLGRVAVAEGVEYHATRDALRQLRRRIDALELRYDPLRTNCNAVVTTLIQHLGYPLPSAPVRGWLPAYGHVILQKP